MLNLVKLCMVMSYAIVYGCTFCYKAMTKMPEDLAKDIIVIKVFFPSNIQYTFIHILNVIYRGRLFKTSCTRM